MIGQRLFALRHRRFAIHRRNLLDKVALVRLARHDRSTATFAGRKQVCKGRHLQAAAGLGRLMVFAINHRDLPLLQSVSMIAVVIFALANLAADLAYAWLNPRIRIGVG